MQFTYRSAEKEYLDNSSIATVDLCRNLIELNVINTHLGGYNGSCKGLHTILKGKGTVKTVLDIGFGGGDSIKALSRSAEKENRKLFFYGVDLKPYCMEYAQNNLVALSNKELICDDYRNISPDLLKKVDVIHCSLFLHHLSDAEIIDLFRFSRAHQCIILVNDLHRHWLAYYLIKVLTRLFSSSYLVKNDAPISVKRGFRRKELMQLLKKAGYTNYSIQWSWAFRFILIAKE